MEFGLSVQETMLKICPDLRTSFSTEPPVDAVHCPGQCIISTQSRLVLLGKGDEENLGQAASLKEKQVVVYK